MEKKYGKDWIDNEFAKLIVIWNSSLFLRNHVKEVCNKYPGLHELCEEYYNSNTISGKSLPEDFHMQIFNFIRSFNSAEELVTFGSSPVKDSYWVIN